MIFFPGLHHPCDARHFHLCMVSINALRKRVSDIKPNRWMRDSGAFSELFRHGKFRSSVEEYAAQVVRWSRCGRMMAAVSQDYMCEPFILEKTGLTVEDHQRLTIARYDAIQSIVGCRVYLMPVLQGYGPVEYVRHIRAYGNRLHEGQWVGVGSVCKRNANIDAIESVLVAIEQERPDLKLHGFGVKLTALESSVVRDRLYSADSMAWSAAARREGRDRNSWHEAMRFNTRIETQEVIKRHAQLTLLY